MVAGSPDSFQPTSPGGQPAVTGGPAIFTRGDFVYYFFVAKAIIYVLLLLWCAYAH